MTDRTINLKEAADIVRHECGEWTGLAETIIRRFKELPTVDVVPVRHGKWTPVTNGRGGFECDRCHNYAPSYQDGVEHLSDWCPNCGADMRKDGDSNA